MTGPSMVLVCPSESLVPRFPADPLVKGRRLWKACGTILFKRLQLTMPLLGRNRNRTYEKKDIILEKEKRKILH
jgi:hypothetical protein